MANSVSPSLKFLRAPNYRSISAVPFNMCTTSPPTSFESMVRSLSATLVALIWTRPPKANVRGILMSTLANAFPMCLIINLLGLLKYSLRQASIPKSF